MTNTGGFLNLAPATYWSGTAYAPDPAVYAWTFFMNNGLEHADEKQFGFKAMAVRAGDVTAVPEPGSYALVLAGLTMLAMRRRSA